MSWDQTLPEDDDVIRDVGQVIRSHKTEFRAAVEKHFYWTDSSNASAGIPRLLTGSTATGSARAFYGTESQVSANRDGALIITSNTSRLFGITSAGNTVLGSHAAVSLVTSPGGNYGVLVQYGQMISPVGTSLLTDASYTTQFPTAYNVAPNVMLSERSSGFGFFSISALTAGGFTVDVHRNGGSNMNIAWRSVGTVTL